MQKDFYEKDEVMEPFQGALIWEYDGDYDMSAFGILLGKDGKLYEVEGSHCSCYALEGQFEPEEVTVEELEFRIKNNKSYGDGYHISYRDQIKEVIKKYRRY